ncbi:MAG: Ni/Fe hydrogenase subunit alpha [Calditerrivibrio sp.]|uniref:Ni/Fe hydrogenase subunit alpha n=1 Tax=Calditerrivibrio sp. TaxID=2792612 RepID=UPI003D0E82A2
MKKITIDPVTRIEGHAKISIYLDDSGEVSDARFHVTQYRGFEKLCEGRPFTEMPRLMARTCGICPVSHLIAASKACDEIMGVKVPIAGVNIRKIINYAQILQSHALSFFYLSSPDLLLGMDAPIEERNIVGVLNRKKDFIENGIFLRKFGQMLIEKLGRKRIHPDYIVPGGVESPVEESIKDEINENARLCIDKALYTIDTFRSVLPAFEEEIRYFSHIPTYHMALSKDGKIEYYDGDIYIIDPEGRIELKFKPEEYNNYISERVEGFSYLKSPYLKIKGYPDGIYRVGPLSRLNIAESCGAEVSDRELSIYREVAGRISNAAFLNHYARLVEIIFCAEKIIELLNDDATFDAHTKANAGVNFEEGVGVSEAPRGTLIHHYKVDRNGIVQWANLIIATGHNNLAMNKGILQAAKRFVKGDDIKEGFLNRVEAVIRCYDPCLSCSTHAVGKMPMMVEIVNNKGERLKEVRR